MGARFVRAAIVVAVSGIVVAAIIANRANRLQERVTVIEEDRRSEELEARGRANVHARLDPPGRPGSLVLSVTGDTPARDVVVKVGPASLLLGEPTPFSSIDPEQVVRLHLAITRDDFLRMRHGWFAYISGGRTIEALRRRI